MLTVAFTTATQLDRHVLRDIGVEADGAVVDPSDPRYRRVVRRASAVDHLLAILSLPGRVLLRA